MAIALAALIFAFFLSCAVTPIVRHYAIRWDFVDRPDGRRKIQATPVSLGGGLALVVTTPIIVWVIGEWWGRDLYEMATRPLSLLGLFGAAVLLTVVGVLDDARGLRGSYKLLWQVIAASMVMGTGFYVPSLLVFGYTIPLGVLGSAFTVVWLLAAINSFNLIDGVDGLAGTVGVIFSLTLGSIALISNQSLDAIIAFSLAGALMGFLRYNLAPATIYLGDTGSMFIGLVLGTIALRCSMKQAASFAFAAPMAVWAIPMFDSMAAVIRRKLTGRSIYATDRGHIHHVLLTHGFKPTHAVALIASLCLVTSTCAVLGLIFENEWIGIGGVIGVIALLVLTRLFGHVEFVLLNRGLFGLGHFVSPFSKQKTRQTSLNLQGQRSWEDLWGGLIESAERNQFVRMRLNLSLPRLNEDFFATWKQAGSHRGELLWQTDVPLMVDGLQVGRLSVSGLQSADSASNEIQRLGNFVQSLESQLCSVLQQELAIEQQSHTSGQLDGSGVEPRDDRLVPVSDGTNSTEAVLRKR